ncbi:uncharacterized protein LOC123298939 [Chrysoperla carnea]|uniref:uncharacterized protein LOC123298939 n=1 Tax=Chrysoperla carnea TaxID=189513 RepID=UPI001D06AA95|nr:uncharacterized protein LOC123298939 [Chrysoperla carnea]
MEVEEKIQKHIINYYKCLELHQIKWKQTVCELKPFIKALKTQIEQFIVVDRYNIEKTEFEKYEFLKERLHLKIYKGIEEEFSSISKLISNLNVICHDLRTKTTQLENLTVTLDWTIDSKSFLVRGSALQRPLGEILDWAYRIMTYYKDVMAAIYDTFQKISYLDANSVQKFEECFYENHEIENLVEHALQYLQLCEQVVVS